VSYSVASNGGSMRTGNLIAASKTVTVTQDGAGLMANATLSPTSISFASVQLNTTSRVKAATLTNSGNVPLSISNILKGGANASEFAVGGNCSGALAVGASCTLQITFTPTATGGRSATITVSTTEGVSRTLTVSGTGKNRGGK
jgi:Flp pilus assembly protein TadG